MRYNMKMRKGMSELMAIVIGVVLTIGIAASLWLVLPTMITSSTKTARVIVSASATYVDNNVAMVSLTIKNIGSIHVNITSIEVLVGNKHPRNCTIVGEEDKDLQHLNLQLAPGKEISMILKVEDPNIKPGAKIVVIVSTNHGNVMSTSIVP